MGHRYTQLSESQRLSIESLRCQEMSCRAIARCLAVGASTVTREIRRNSVCAVGKSSHYVGVMAQSKASQRRTQCGAARRKLGADTTTPRWRSVLSGLRCGWSPEQIAGKLAKMDISKKSSPGPALSASHETIYTAIYAMARGTLRTELVGALRKSHKKRMPRSRGTARKDVIRNMTPISLRPPEVAARIVPGHWEGDLIKGAMNRSAVGTLVERTSRYIMLVKLDGLSAEDILAGFARRLKTIPESLRLTMTYDQGTEMALHERLSAQLKMDIYFCDPHSPWQRGSNENANGMIREYLPKGMDLSIVSHQHLSAIERALNYRPRKIIGFQTPHEVFSNLTSDQIASVALHA